MTINTLSQDGVQRQQMPCLTKVKSFLHFVDIGNFFFHLHALKHAFCAVVQILFFSIFSVRV